MSSLSSRAAKRLERLLKTLDRALDQMEGSVEINGIVDGWRGSMNIRENIQEFIEWQGKRLPS